MLSDVEPTKSTIAQKPYPTLSRSQCARRLDDMHRHLLRRVIHCGTAYLRAKITLFRKHPEFLEAELMISEWEELHRSVGRLPARLHDRIYPWGRPVPAPQYRKIIEARRERLLKAVARTHSALDTAIGNFESRVEFIRRGRAWLNTTEARSTGQVNHASAPALAPDGSAQDRSANASPGESREMSAGAREHQLPLVVTGEQEAHQVRLLEGWQRWAPKQTGALIGDGCDMRDYFTVAAKIADRAYFWSAVDQYIGQPASVAEAPPSAFSLDAFIERRHVLTDMFMHRATISGYGQDAVLPPVEGNARARPVRGLSDPPIVPASTLLASLPMGGIVTGTALSGRSCDALFLQAQTEGFEPALCTLDAGRSFIITGAAGTGKSSMVPGLISYCLENNKKVKVVARADTLTALEARCKAIRLQLAAGATGLEPIREKDGLRFDGRTTVGAATDAHEDVLIIDDATLVPFQSELLSRPRQTIVIGDDRQISIPGSMFSIAGASGIKPIRLHTSYRSQNRGIMTWSGLFVYGDEMLFPHGGNGGSEVRYVPLGRRQKHAVDAEARAVAHAAVQAAAEGGTVGIVAFGAKQAAAIAAKLEETMMETPVFLGLPEQIQGMEADTVLVSVGVALTETGRLPVQTEGLDDDQAIMRMNVALTRAKSRTLVFSSLLPDDIDLRTASGAQIIIRSVLETFSRVASG